MVVIIKSVHEADGGCVEVEVLKKLIKSRSHGSYWVVQTVATISIAQMQEITSSQSSFGNINADFGKNTWCVDLVGENFSNKISLQYNSSFL